MGAILITFVLIKGVLYGQGETWRILEKPTKYQHPVDNLDLSDSKDRVTTLPWIVFSDRSENVSYSDTSKSKARSRLGFFEWYYVVEEEKDFVHVVKDSIARALTLSKAAKDFGWIEKKRVLLWERCLVTEVGDIPKRVMMANTISYARSQQGKDLEKFFFRTGPSELFALAKDSAGAYDFYFILKSENSWVLLSRSTRLLFDQSGRVNDSCVAGWVPSSRVSPWPNRLAIEPNWELQARQERENGKRSLLFASIETAVKYKNGLEVNASDIWWNSDSLKERPDGSWRRFPIVRSVANAPGIVEVMAQGDSKNAESLAARAYTSMVVKGQQYPLFKRVLLLDRSELYDFVATIENLVRLMNSRDNITDELSKLLRERNIILSEAGLQDATINRIYELIFGFSSPTRRFGGLRIDELKDPAILRETDLQDYTSYLSAKARHLKQIADKKEGDYKYMFRSNGTPYYWIEEELIP
jgi:hypothetical protein